MRPQFFMNRIHLSSFHCAKQVGIMAGFILGLLEDANLLPHPREIHQGATTHPATLICVGCSCVGSTNQLFISTLLSGLRNSFSCQSPLLFIIIYMHVWVQDLFGVSSSQAPLALLLSADGSNISWRPSAAPEGVSVASGCGWCEPVAGATHWFLGDLFNLFYNLLHLNPIGRTPVKLATKSTKEFYKDLLEQEDFIPSRRSFLRRRAGLKSTDPTATWHPSSVGTVIIIIILIMYNFGKCGIPVRWHCLDMS